MMSNEILNYEIKKLFYNDILHSNKSFIINSRQIVFYDNLIKRYDKILFLK